ncbi:hypothetical protein AC792_01370 [Arthrobacter sp. RIT-PI-e]|nr:hypothetical protein AC792_01370 [Arthrobacter sp. RIT-PI-e]
MPAERINPEPARAFIDADIDPKVIGGLDVLRGQYFSRFTSCQDLPGSHQNEVIGDACGVVQVMQYHPDGNALKISEVTDKVQCLDLVAQIEVVRRLIQ